MRIAFHTNHLDLRGTGVAVYDYAHHCETQLGLETLIVCPSVATQPHFQDERAAARFETRFAVHRYDRFEQVDELLEELEVDVFYAIKAGPRDHVVSKRCKTLVHAILQHREPHGDVYAYLSEWLSREMSDGALPFVPPIVDLPDVAGDLRDCFGVPREAVVFGRYGARETFDIPFVQEAVRKVAESRPDVFFLFMNTEPFCERRPNILHLRGTFDREQKVRFINSCDAMLHARRQGESFGLAVAEFSSRNRPVITWTGGSDRAHLEQLGDKALRYEHGQQLLGMLNDFEPSPGADWDAYSRSYSPPVVMRRFSEVFLG